MIFVSVLLAFVACVRGLPASEEIRAVSPMPAADRLFHVYTLPVGQGNAQVIQCPSGEISIFDMGTCTRNTSGFWIAQNITDFLQGKFHLVTNIFLTHSDRDHFNLLDKVFLNASYVNGLQSIYISRVLGEWDQSIRNWVNKINATNKVESFNNGSTCGSSSPLNTSCENVTLCPRDSGITTKVLSVNAGEQCSNRSSNADSIVLEVTYGSFKLQLNGDFEDCGTSPNEKNSPQKAMADAYYENVSLTVYMLSHHGAESKANKKVIRDAVAPKAVVASSNPFRKGYSHPRCAIIDAFINGTSLCEPGETNTSSQFYCGQHPNANATLEDKLQKNYTCGVNSTTLRNVTTNDYAIYSTTPDEWHINLVELQTNGTEWGFINWIHPLIPRKTTSESMAPKEDDECVDED